jgi:hypothetical protein
MAWCEVEPSRNLGIRQTECRHLLHRGSLASARLVTTSDTECTTFREICSTGGATSFGASCPCPRDFAFEEPGLGQQGGLSDVADFVGASLEQYVAQPAFHLADGHGRVL